MFIRQANQDVSITGTMFIMTLLAFATGRVASQRYQHQILSNENQQNPNDVGRDFEAGERVEKLASASGDQFYQRPQMLADLYRQYALSKPVETRETDNDQLIIISPDLSQRMQQQQQQQPQSNRGQQLILDPYSLDFRAFMNEFKRQSPLANPSREGRAFKPKLMSTARGFGKRAGASSVQHHVTYADLLAAANPAGIMAANGKANSNSLR